MSVFNESLPGVVISPPDSAPLDVSVIVPVTERPEPLPELYNEYAPALRAAGYSLEFIFVGGPWREAARESLAGLIRAGEPVRVLEVGQAMPESTLARIAASHAQGGIVLTLPAYHRVEADALPGLIRRIESGVDLAVARRWPRRDSWINQVQNRFLHWLLAGLGRGRIHDVACGVRAMRRAFLLEVPLYGELFRFLPLLALREGYEVEEIDAPQHPRDLGTRIYAPGTYLRRLIDVLGLFFLLRFTEKPLRFFGMLGSVAALFGGLLLAVGVYERLAGAEGLADRPILLFGVLAIVLGVQAIALGLIGEIIVHLQAKRTPTYRVSEIVSRSR